MPAQGMGGGAGTAVAPAHRGLPVRAPVSRRLVMLRGGLAIVYAALLLMYPTTVRDAAVADWVPIAVLGWVALTSTSVAWRRGRRSVVVTIDFVVVAVLQVAGTDVLLSGVLPTLAVVVLAALPANVTRRVGPSVVGLVGVALLGATSLAVALWLTGITAAVVVMMERARHEATLAWLRAARSAAYVNRLQRSARDAAEQIALAAEQGRPIAHDITGSVGSIGALGRRLDRDGTTPRVAALADDMDAALAVLRQRLEQATEFARQHLHAVVPQAGPPVGRVGWRLGGIRLQDAVAYGRVAAIVGFVVLVVVLHGDLTRRALAIALAVAAIVVSIPARIRGADSGWVVAVHVNDSIAIVVAMALVDGLTGPIAPALVIHAALVSLSLRPRQARPVVVATWVGLMVLGATEGGVAGMLLALWWCLVFALSLQWLLELRRHILVEARRVAEFERGRATARRVSRSAERLARDLDGAFAAFSLEVTAAARQCREVADHVVQLGGRSARVGEVLLGEADHLLGLLADLERRSSAGEAPLVLSDVAPASLVVSAAGVAVTEGNATVVDDTAGRSVVTDAHVVEVCVRNLVSNALRHRLREPVRIRVASDGDTWSVCVADDGPGLDPDEFERLTHKYVQAAGDVNTGAYGLGLWIVRSSIDRLGGHVVSERQGGWFTVTIALPVEPRGATIGPGATDRSRHDD